MNQESLAGPPARFEVRTGPGRHHLVCRVCGRIEDTGCVVVTAPCLTLADSAGYRVDEAEVVFWGRCPDCRLASQSPLSPDAAR
jgi:Fur family transcriptional regulator, stress-responsive regulator